MENTPKGQDPSKKPRKRSDLGGLYHGLQFAVTTMVGLAAGYWLDQHYLPAPLGTLGGLLGGSIMGMYILARTVK